MSDLADRQLLFAVLAFQLERLDLAQLSAACRGWAADKSRPIADLIQERGWITAEDRQFIEREVERKLRRGGEDVYATLGKLASPEVREAVRLADDSDLRGTLQKMPPAAGHVVVETLVKPTEQVSRYSLTMLHGQGGLGRVWRARDTDLGREVALKEIRPDRVADAGSAADTTKRFLKEAQVTGQLEHPNIVPVYELARRPQDDQPFYTMRFVSGRTLTEVIREFHAPAKPKEATKRTVTLSDLLRAFATICHALHYAHSRGVIHRDLKPDNVILGDYGEVQVLDWGLAKLIDRPDEEIAPISISPQHDPGQTVAGSQLGTVLYMAPEQASGRIDLIDARTDVYGLGAILFEILTGQPPHTSEPGITIDQLLHRITHCEVPHARARRPAVPRALDAICAKAMAKLRADRYSTADALREEVQHWLDDEPVSVAPDRPAQQVARFARKNRGVVGTSMAALLLIAVGAIIAAVLINQQRREVIRLAGAEKLKTIELRSSVARNDLAHGLNEYEKGRLSPAIQDIWRAWQIVPETDPIRQGILNTALDRATLGGRALCAPLQHGKWIGFAAFSPNGDRVITLGDDGTARLWDGITGQPIGAPIPHEFSTLQAIFSPNGERVLTYGGSFLENGAAWLWDANSGLPLGKPMRHPKSVKVVDFSPDGRFIATGSEDGTARLWDVEIGEPWGAVMSHGGKVADVVFSPDGRQLATGSQDATARLWDAQTGRPVTDPIRHVGEVNSVMFSPNGDYLLITGNGPPSTFGSPDPGIQLWSVRTGRVIGDSTHYAGAYSGAFSPDSTRLVSIGAVSAETFDEPQCEARLWDTVDGQMIGERMSHLDAINATAFSPDGRLLCTVSNDNTVRLWDGRTGAALSQTEPMMHDDDVLGVEFSPDGNRVLTYSRDHTTRIWDATTGANVSAPLHHDSAVYNASFSPDGEQILTRTSEGLARIWSSRPLEPLSSSIPIKSDFVMVLPYSFSSDGKRLAIANGDNVIQVWDSESGTKVGTGISFSNEIISLKFASDGNRLLTVNGKWPDDSREMRLWDVQTSAPLNDPARVVDGRNIISSSDGNRLLTYGSNYQLEFARARLWSVHNSSLSNLLLAHDSPVLFGAFAPDGTRIFTWSNDAIWIWDTRFETPQSTRISHSGLLTGLIVSPTGNSLAICSESIIQLRDGRTGEKIRGEIPLGESTVSVVFSPNGERLVISEFVPEGGSMIAQIYDGRTGTPIGVPIDPNDIFVEVKFSPDGTRLLTGANTAVTRLWNAETGDPLGEPMRHQAVVYSVGFSPDSQRILTGSEDKTARLWDGWTGAPLGEPILHNSTVKVADFSPDGQRILTGDAGREGSREGGQAHLWDATLKRPQTPEGTAVWLELLTGFQRSPEQKLVSLTEQERQQRWAKLRELEPNFLDQLRTHHSSQAEAAHHRLAAQSEKLAGDMRSQREWAHQLRERGRDPWEIGIFYDEDVEFRGWFAAEFHLRQLCRLHPEDADLRKRLVRAQQYLAEQEPFLPELAPETP